jgi:subtilisin family serine protease
MLRRFVPCAAVVLSLLACQDPASPRSASSVASPGARSTAAEDDSYIVLFNRSVTTVDDKAAEVGREHGGRLTRVYRSAVHGFAGRFSAAAAAAIARRPDVALVERDAVMRIGTTQTGATWGIDRIDQRVLPLSTSYSYNATGAGVHVYIIDTGIRTTHTQFGGRADGVFSVISDGVGTSDCHGHGTHVAGTVGAAAYGVAKQVLLHAVRVLDCTGAGSTSGILAGIDWVTANHASPAVANMSLIGGPSSALDSAVAYSVKSGVTYVVAAGNFDTDACLFSPGRAAEAITVGATTSTDMRPSFSNFGTCLDLFAPGESITSAWYTSDFAIASSTGTSMASPHVAGAAALYLQLNPGATPADVTSALLSNATIDVVANAGTGSPNRLLYTGFIGGDGGPNQAPVARFTWSCPSQTCTLNATTSTDDGGIVSYSWDLGKFPDPTASGPVVSVTYPHLGSRTVTLTVTDGGGLTSSVTKTIEVASGGSNQPPTASFTT